MFSDEFLNIKTDFGFKKFVQNQDTLICFLNSVLPRNVIQIENSSEVRTVCAPSSTTNLFQENLTEQRRASISNLVNDVEEEIGDSSWDKTTRYDLVCIDEQGRRFNVEMQQSFQECYFHRALYYSARLISRQGFKGNREDKSWAWKLQPTFHIALLSFDFKKIEEVPEHFKDCWKVWTTTAIDGSKCLPTESDSLVLNSDLLNICLISLRQFNKRTPASLSKQEKFIYLFNHLGDGRVKLPEWVANEFNDLLLMLKVNSLNPMEEREYENSLARMKDEHDSQLRMNNLENENVWLKEENQDLKNQLAQLQSQLMTKNDAQNGQ